MKLKWNRATVKIGCTVVVKVHHQCAGRLYYCHYIAIRMDYGKGKVELLHTQTHIHTSHHTYRFANEQSMWS